MLAVVVYVLLISTASACDSRGGSVCISIINNCPFTIWPGILGPGNPEGGGFRLDPYQTRDIHVPNKWTAGRIWARRDCDENFNCATGFCGNKLQCNGAGGRPPASLAEFTLNAHGGQDYYDVSLVDGYNLPVWIEPVEGSYSSGGGQYECKRAGGCLKDLNDPNLCPKELRDEKNGQIVGCKSACFAFNDPYFCCAGQFSTPDKCNAANWPTNYAGIFKSACPTAYSYAYDDHTSTFTCRGNGSPSPAYKVQFC